MQRKIITLIAGFMLSAPCFAQNKYFQPYIDSAALKKDNDALIADFETMVQQVQPGFSINGLTTAIPEKFMPGMYLHKTNKIYHVTWQTGWPPMQDFLVKMAGTSDSAQTMGALFFHGYFFPHEVGHALQYHSNNVPKK